MPGSGDLLCARDAALAHPDNTRTRGVAGLPEKQVRIAIRASLAIVWPK